MRIGLNLAAIAILVSCGCGSYETAHGDAGKKTPEAATRDASATGPQSNRPANRLAHEPSPYLRLHAHNPVDWYPWGPEAFEKARKEQKPIFLSIGYSSCYWCHVMERLVFSDEEIARQMNEHFVNIKVDREERPDLDDIYMTCLQIYFQLSGSDQGGGWPLSMFLTPEGKPFAGGTYFPPKDDQGRDGFPTVLERIVQLWQTQRKDLENNAEIITVELRRLMKPELALEKVEPDRALVSSAVEALAKSYDPEHGGVGFDPKSPDGTKFPSPPKLVLLQVEAAKGNADAEKILAHTLERIAYGGIRDHLGGGFHRYSTDRAWHVPHFEKMLYDQAQLAELYVEHFDRTGRPLDREAAEGAFDFVLREMTDPRGGFYSALDAETGGVEGKYYVWSRREVEQRLGRGDSALFMNAYGLDAPQQFEHGYVLHLPRPLDQLAAEINISADEFDRRISDARRTLLEIRNKRTPLLRDDKVLTSWNGLMIRALARGAAALDRDDYMAAAEKAGVFILSEMRDEKGRLRRAFRDEGTQLGAYLDDYAFLTAGLLALYDVTGRDKWLHEAQRLTDDQIELFWDDKSGGLFFTSHNHEQLIARIKNAYDSVLPSGNSQSVRNLVRLTNMTGNPSYRERAVQTVAAFAATLKRAPGNMSSMAVALDDLLGTTLPETSKPAEPAAIVQVAAEVPQTKAEEPELVSAQVYLSQDKLAPGGTCRVAMILKIQDRWHINANPARPDFVIPTTVALKSEQGARLKDLQFPPGKNLKMQGFDEPLSVYEKSVTIYGTLEAASTAKPGVDKAEFQIRFQACDDKHCLAPKSIKIQGKLTLAKPGEPIQAINPKIFAPANGKVPKKAG
jgi:uncharacterized protein YyaL (SSP411 family)